MIDPIAESKRLTEASIPTQQADAIVRLVAKTEDSALTRDYLDYKLELAGLSLDSKLSNALAPIKTDIAILTASATYIKLFLSFQAAVILTLFAGMVTIIVKAQFP